ncbi:MAG: hypothetical protein E7022_03250 [Desulfovibrio desulfuricans]|nr:hypothetical protein [Desulfovibrio desulfuricans]
MPFSISETIKKVVNFRRSGDTLIKEHAETDGGMVLLTARNGVTGANAQAEFEVVRRELNSHVSGECSTAAGTTEKVLNASNFILRKGATVIVRFANTNTANNPTLNVNNTGAKSIYFQGAAIEARALMANNTYLLYYNGEQYDLISADIITAYQTQLAEYYTLLTNMAARVSILETRLAEIVSWCASELGYEESQS